MFKKIDTISKKFIVISLFFCVLAVGGFFLALTLMGRGVKSDKKSLTDIVYKNYENFRGNAESTTIKSLPVNELTLNIYDMFFENNEIVLKYDLMKNNTIISNQTIYSFVIFDKNQSIDYKLEYSAKAFVKKDSSPTLAVLREENMDTALNYQNKTIKMTISIYYKLDKDSKSLSQDFEFNYTPKKIYDETIIRVNHEFSYLNEQIKMKQIIFNGLYTLLECDYKHTKFSDVWYSFEVFDEFGKKVANYGASVGDESSIYYYDKIGEKATKLYLYPIAHKYDANKKEKITPIDEKIEVKLH